MALAKSIEYMFGSDCLDSLSSFTELTTQKGVDDLWYASVLSECRMGELSEES